MVPTEHEEPREDRGSLQLAHPKGGGIQVVEIGVRVRPVGPEGGGNCMVTGREARKPVVERAQDQAGALEGQRGCAHPTAQATPPGSHGSAS